MLTPSVIIMQQSARVDVFRTSAEVLARRRKITEHAINLERGITIDLDDEKLVTYVQQHARQRVPLGVIERAIQPTLTAFAAVCFL